MALPGTNNIVLEGLIGSQGVAIGSALILDEKHHSVKPQKIGAFQTRAHLKRFKKAKEKLLAEIDQLSANLDATTAEIFEAQKHIISDVELEKRIKDLISEDRFTIDYAIHEAFNTFINQLRNTDSEFFKQRIVDLENLRDRLIDLANEDEKEIEVEKGAILVVRDISPTDLVAYYDHGIAGLVMEKGGVTSHAAIIAQSLNLPCLVSVKNCKLAADYPRQIILDANVGELIVNPDQQTLNTYKKKIKQLEKDHEEQLSASDRSETTDGESFHLYANVEFVQELPILKQHNIKGIGLLRTEALLYSGIGHKQEADQISFYEEVLANVEGRVVIRLFDVGGDKLHFEEKDENNPFLGWRGIRMLLDERELLETQIKAILKVSGKYPDRIYILVPMVTVIEEIQEVKRVLEDSKRELLSAGVEVDESIKIGIMVEVPSVAILADQFAKEVDFLSVGTNDLTQYSLAVDRGNERICSLYQHYHPAVLQLIRLTAEAATKNGIELSVCGELAGDIVGAAFLFGLGVTHLSISPSSIPKIRHLLSSYSNQEFSTYAQKVLQVTTAMEVKEHFEALF